MKKIINLAFLFAFSSPLFAQETTGRLSAPDEHAQKLGALEAFNVATIADTLTQTFSDKKDKARSIFYWIANNIALDGKAVHSNDNKNSDPVIVIESRKATPLGFAMLVQEMCSMAKIRCLVVDGYVKNNPEDINNKPDELNHSWNVVQLGQSPEEWYLVDAAKASGYLDKKQLFTKRFTSEYFFADKTLFNLDHYPDNHAWELGTGPKSEKEFFALPVIGNAAYKYGLQKPVPQNGFIKTKSSVTNKFQFNYTAGEKTIANISLVMGEGNKLQKPEPVNFTTDGGAVSFTYKFKKEDSYPVRIMVDGNEILDYMVDVSE